MEETEQTEELIPGLPDDVATECLIRVPPLHSYKLGMVRKPWKSAAATPYFAHRLREYSQSRCPNFPRRCGKFILALQKDESQLNVPSSDRNCRLLLFDIEKKRWECESLSTFPAPLPRCSVISVTGENLVVIGDLTVVEPREQWPSQNSVWVYNFRSEKWRGGAPMPGPRRVFFAHASDGIRTIFVAGGWIPATDESLGSAMAYDVERDEWSPLPPMVKKRSFCFGSFSDHKFYVQTYMCCCEALDTSSFSWCMLEVWNELGHETYAACDDDIALPDFSFFSGAGSLWLPMPPGDLDPWGGGCFLRASLELEHSYFPEWRHDTFHIHWRRKMVHETELPEKYKSPINLRGHNGSNHTKEYQTTYTPPLPLPE
ncbi:hypothetical protein H6P81_003713 [Aristolochia fimbriata]|uniref:Uncharacterized protein n=1 Tax=Aristolochia fimbriata TaxID=158543 RepID=A0AAV7FGA8_ARIFI|nr:hypothetical protein H6P81_003713 [Aristolochia fimbriata]